VVRGSFAPGTFSERQRFRFAIIAQGVNRDLKRVLHLVGSFEELRPKWPLSSGRNAGRAASSLSVFSFRTTATAWRESTLHQPSNSRALGGEAVVAFGEPGNRRVLDRGLLPVAV